MSLTLRPGRRWRRRKTRARARGAKARKTSGRSAGSITRKLRDILRPARIPDFRIIFSDGLIIAAHVGFAHHRRRGSTARPYDPHARDLADSISGVAQRARDGPLSARRPYPGGLGG